MFPILFSVPGAVLKATAGLALVGGLLLAIVAFARGGSFRKRWQTPGLAIAAGGLVLARIFGGGLSAAAWQAGWSALPVYSYGLMFGLSLFVGWQVALRFAVRDGLPEDQTGTLYIVAAVSSVVFARLLYVITQPSELEGGLLAILNTRRGGLVAYGGMIGCIVGSVAYCRWRKLPLLVWADAGILAVSLGTAITRIGCLLYGCDYGRPAPTLPWGIRFPRGSQAHADHVRRKLIDATAAFSERVHPTQIYESLLGLSAFLVLLWVRSRRRFAGQVFLAFVLYYGALRYAIEVYRGDEDRAFVGFFSTSQLIAVVTMGLAVVLYVYLHRRAGLDPEAARPWEALRNRETTKEPS